MQRKVIVSGPVRGKLTEGKQDRGPGRAVLRDTLAGQVRGTKAPPREDRPKH